MATIIDVANKANVSPSTVSRYFHNKNLVSKEKAEIIEKAVIELGYVPNISASFLKSQKNNLVGLFYLVFLTRFLLILLKSYLKN